MTTAASDPTVQIAFSMFANSTAAYPSADTGWHDDVAKLDPSNLASLFSELENMAQEH